jgi:hypothetical protein
MQKSISYNHFQKRRRRRRRRRQTNSELFGIFIRKNGKCMHIQGVWNCKSIIFSFIKAFWIPSQLE